MSRINEALKRIGGETVADLRNQQAFRTAWSGLEAVPEPVTETGPERPSMFHLPPPRRSDVGIGFSSEWKERLAIAPSGDPTLIEQFRHVAAVLRNAQQASGLKSVMVTSAEPGDGKTLTAVNLALVLSESYRYNVLLIDADLRRPSIPGVLEFGGGSGLSEALRSTTDQKLTLVQVSAGLTVLPAGQPIANSIEALTSPRMQLIMQEAGQRYDWVILDAPPVGPTADAHLLTKMVGGTIFVIHAGRTQYPDVQDAVKALGRDQILGVILNGVELSRSKSHYYYSPESTEIAKT